MNQIERYTIKAGGCLGSAALERLLPAAQARHSARKHTLIPLTRFTALMAAMVLQSACLPPSAQARSVPPDTWQFEMVQSWRRDQPGAKEHTRHVQVSVKGNNMRREEGNMITIDAGGWTYYLEKDKKQGIKQPARGKSAQLVSRYSPVGFARYAQQHGKKIGTERIAGQPMTIYQVDPNTRVWVGPDGLAYKTEGRNPEYGVYTWVMRNLRRGLLLPDSLFRPPAGYKVNQVVMPPLRR